MKIKSFIHYYILIFCSITINNNLFSQQFNGGLMLGATLSQVDGDNYGGYHKIMPTGGVYVRSTFSDNFEMNIGIEYKQKGCREVQKDKDGATYFFYHSKLSYVEIPILFSKNIKELKLKNLFYYKFKNPFFLDMGVSIGYLIKGTENTGSGDIVPTYRPYSKFETALNCGITYYITPHWAPFFKISYTFPLLPIKQHPGGQVYLLNRGQYNNNLNFGIKYEF